MRIYAYEYVKKYDNGVMAVSEMKFAPRILPDADCSNFSQKCVSFIDVQPLNPQPHSEVK